MSNRLEGQQIYRRIPHAGAMCLLDAVEAWDAQGIACWARSHTRQNHPLREAGRLSSLHAIEYAAQAAALHASLVGERTADRPFGHAYIATLHAIDTCPRPLDDDDLLTLPLDVRARLAMGTPFAARYTFSVTCGPICVAQGAMTVATPE